MKILLIFLIIVNIVNPVNQVNGVNLQGNWTDENIQIVRDTIFYLSIRLKPIRFESVFKNITLVWGEQNSSKMCKIRGVLACAISNKQVNIFRLPDTKKASINLILHELGHVFSKRLNGIPCKSVPDSISLSKSEAFADMFAGWVMDDLGDEEKVWMNENMPRFLDYALNRRMDNTLDKNMDIMYAMY